MADYGDLVTLRETPGVKNRLAAAMQAAAHAIFANGAATVQELKLAREIANEPFVAEERLALQVLTGSAILAKINALNTVTDAELQASAAEVLAGLAKAA